MKIAMGCDQGGFHLKEHIKKYLQDKGIEVVDHGTYSEDSVDYPDFAEKLCKDITSGESGAERGILICGTGIGISIAANKCKGIRAALCAMFSLRKCPVSITMLMFCAWASAFWALAWQR